MDISNGKSAESLSVAVTTNSSSEDDQLAALMKEYELSQNSLEELNNRIIQVVGVGIGVISFVAGYVLSQGSFLPLVIAWLTPAVSFMFFALLLLSIYQGNSKVWVCRLLSWRINAMLPETSLISYEQNLPSGIFFSTRRGNFKVKIVYSTLIVGSIVLFLAITIVSLGVIYTSSHLWGTLYLTINAFLIVLGLLATSGIFYDLPQAFRKFQLECEARGYIPTMSDLQYIKSARHSFGEVIQLFVPRSWDFAVKFIYVIYGALAAYVIVGLQPEQLPIVNGLFGPPSGWRSVADVSWWAIILLVSFYLFVEEILLQQAKLLWDDIRDIDRDKLLPLNSRRALVSQLFDTRSAIVQMSIRWLAALAIGYILGGIPLLALFVAISIHQALYELWSKPHMARHPLQALFIISFNIALRFLVGVLAIVGGRWTFTPIIFVFCMFYFASLGGMAIIWRLEGEHLKQKSENEQQDFLSLKPQGPFFIAHGSFWQHVGLNAAYILPALLVALHYTSCETLRWGGSALYGGCNAMQQSISLELGPVLTMIGIGVLILVGLVVSIALVALARIIGLFGIGVLLTAVGILFLLNLPSCVSLTSLVALPHQVCHPNIPAPSAHMWDSDATVLMFIVGAVLSCAAFVLLSHWLSRWVWRIFPKVKTLLLAICYSLAVILIVFSVLNRNAPTLLMGFVFLNVGYLILYEGMTYEEYSLELLRKRWPFIVKAWYAYFFQPVPGLGILHLLMFTFSDSGTELATKMAAAASNTGQETTETVEASEEQQT